MEERLLVQHEDSCVQDAGALLAPGTSAEGILEACDDDSDGCLQRPEKKRRLTSDQIQILEKNFELENRLEPERKVRIAQDLGLQPRQIAIWFQNRRARWKAKHLEKEYETLKNSYDNLKSDHDNLLKEKEELESQVFSLTKLLTSRNQDQTEFELSELHRFTGSLETRDSSLVSESGNANAKQNVRSANSSVLDSDTGMVEPTCCSSNAVELVQSDLSQVGGADEIKLHHILSSMEDDSCTYEFHLEDQFYWFWP